MNNFTNKKIEKYKGFTIIETLVAIFVLLVSTTGPLTFAQSGLRSSFLARDQITAFYLAQDAIEQLKNDRDTTALENRGLSVSEQVNWLESFASHCKPDELMESVACNFDDDVVEQCSTVNGCSSPMYFDPTTRKFSIGAGDGKIPSKYIRTIYVTELIADREAQIIVKVKWDSNFFAIRRIIIQENIYNI